MIISTIVAANQNNIIGDQNQIPWYLPADLIYFKKITSGHHVLMGRKCFESIGRPLPNRTNIVITNNPYFIVSNCVVMHSIEQGILFAKKNGETELFIIGGGEIYKKTQHLWDRIYLTEVEVECTGDVYFPIIDPQEWKLISSEAHLPNEKNKFPYKFKILERL